MKILLKSVLTKKQVKTSSTKRWCAIKAVGFAVKAVVEEKPKVNYVKRRSSSKMETVRLV